MRVGVGFDMHAFGEARPLILGGVTVPCEQGLRGHSDADVLVHALIDALLGAMRAGDIGTLFPDTDPAYKGISSIVLLRRVASAMHDSGWCLTDADCVLALERPKIAEYRDEMRQAIAAALGVSQNAIGVKATTTEGLGAVGRGEGAAAYAVVLLERARSVGDEQPSL